MQPVTSVFVCVCFTANGTSHKHLEMIVFAGRLPSTIFFSTAREVLDREPQCVKVSMITYTYRCTSKRWHLTNIYDLSVALLVLCLKPFSRKVWLLSSMLLLSVLSLVSTPSHSLPSALSVPPTLMHHFLPFRAFPLSPCHSLHAIP